MNKFNLIYQPFPEEIQGLIPGFTGHREDDYTVFIDSTQTEEKQDLTLRHELSHLWLGHLDEDKRTETSQAYLDNIDEIEAEANNYADQMTDEELSYLMTFAQSVKRLSGHYDQEYHFIPA